MIRNPVSFIGQKILGSTPGDILYVDPNSVLGQDPTLFFDDVNKRLGIGTNSLDTSKITALTNSTTEYGLSLKGISGQTANLFRISDSNGNVILGTNVGSATSSLNIIDSLISPITYSSAAQLICSNWSSKQTFNSATSSLVGYYLNGELEFNAVPSSLVPFTGVYVNPLLRFKTNSIGTLFNASFYSVPRIVMDGFAGTYSQVGGMFHDAPDFSIANSGSYSLLNHISFYSAGNIGTGVAGTLRVAYQATNVTLSGTGSLASQYGFYTPGLSGATTNISIYILGSAQSRHVPKIKIGADAAPSVDMDINGALSVGRTTVSLTADNQIVSTANKSYLALSSDNATATNRTFVLTQSTTAGQILMLEWVGTNAGELVDDSAQNGGGNHRLSATWTPTQYDTLTLMSNGTDWVEQGRSTN